MRKKDILREVKDEPLAKVKERKRLDGKFLLIIDESGEVVRGGIVVNEEKALATPCHGYDLGLGKKLVWSEGIVGALSLPEQEKYCKLGMDIKPAPSKLANRIKAMRGAGVKF